MTEASDDELMAQFAQGRGESFAILFHRHYACAWRYARAILGESGLSEETLQEAFLSLAHSAQRYEAQGQFRPYLLRIVRNLCFNRLASAASRRNPTTARPACEPHTTPA